MQIKQLLSILDGAVKSMVRVKANVNAPCHGFNTYEDSRTSEEEAR